MLFLHFIVVFCALALFIDSAYSKTLTRTRLRGMSEGEDEGNESNENNEDNEDNENTAPGSITIKNPLLSTNVPLGFCSLQAAYALPNGGAKEILARTGDALGYRNVFVNTVPNPNPQGITPLPEAVWGVWQANGGTDQFQTNFGERFVVFNGVCFWKSPNVNYPCSPIPNPTVPSCYQSILYPPPTTPTSPRYAWANIATGACGFTYPADKKAVSFTLSGLPNEKHVFVTITNKCFSYYYAPGTPYIYITDKWGNKYVMHAATEQVDMTTYDPKAAGVKLPAGWKIVKGTVPATGLKVNPLTYSSAGTTEKWCYSVVLRDNLGNGYHQATWENTRLQANPHGNTCGLFSVAMEDNTCYAATVGLPHFASTTTVTGDGDEECDSDGEDEN